MKVEGIIPTVHFNQTSLDKVLSLDKLPMNTEINATVKAIELLNDNIYSVILDSKYGMVKVPLPYDSHINQKLIVNQNISIGLYDVPDRVNFLQLKIVIDSITRINETIYQVLVKRDNSYDQLLKHDDIVDITQANIIQKLYKLLVIDNSGHKLDINLELNDSGNDIILLKSNDFYININDKFYQVIGDDYSLTELLSLVSQKAFVTINQEFDLKKDFISLIDILPNKIPGKTLIEAALFLQIFQAPESIPTNYLATYISFFLPFLSKFKNAKLKIKESHGSSRSHRLVFEFESQEGHLTIVDCLYISPNNYVNIVVRSEYELISDIKTRFIRACNMILSEINLSGSVTFSIQSHKDLSKVLQNSPDQNYTCTV